jgi:hypothetical protein
MRRGQITTRTSFSFLGILLKSIRRRQKPKPHRAFLALQELPPTYDECDENTDPFLQFIPAHIRDVKSTTTRQQRQKAATGDRAYGMTRPTSATIGTGAWEVSARARGALEKARARLGGGSDSTCSWGWEREM